MVSLNSTSSGKVAEVSSTLISLTGGSIRSQVKKAEKQLKESVVTGRAQGVPGACA